MSENTDPLLLREAEEPPPIVPAIGVCAFRLRYDGNGLQIGKPVESDRLRQAHKELSRFQDLHRNQRLPREPYHVPHQYVRFLTKLQSLRMVIGGRRTVRTGRFRSVDAERSIGASEEELLTVSFDGFDLGRAISEELERVVGAVHHFRLLIDAVLSSPTERNLPLGNASNDVVL